MAETSGFFNARVIDGTYDRSYDASTFAEYFSNFVGNGIFQKVSSALLVTENTTPNMSVRLLGGTAFINGYWYKNSEPIVLPIEVADGIYGRIDSVVLRYDYDERIISAIVKKGAPAPSPSAPSIIRNSTYYELEIAQVNVNAGLTMVRNQNIVDNRSNRNVCGWVQAAVQSIDTTYFGNQLNQFITRYINNADAEFQEYLDTLDVEYARFRDVFQDLLERLRQLIDDDDALGELVLEQRQVRADLTDTQNDVTQLRQDLDNVSTTIAPMVREKETRYTKTTTTISASSWTLNGSYYQYSFESTYPSSRYDLEIDLNWDSATNEQVSEYMSNQIVGSYSGNKIVARSGSKPTKNYPLTLKITDRTVTPNASGS